MLNMSSSETATTSDGRSLHLERHGTGSPTVVFESGLGASRNEWGAVVALLGDQVTSVVYDRSGLGRSAADPAPRDLERLSSDLLDVLAHLGGGPFVLVGHSWGGPIVRTAATRRPDLVAGLVLVDQSDERCDLFFAKGNERQNRWSPWLLPLLARVGAAKGLVKRFAPSLPEPWRTAFLAEDGTVAASRAQVAELAGHIDDLRRLRDAGTPLPDVPVSVISGTVTGRMEAKRRPALIAAHAATAAATPQGRHVLADGSSHYVPFTEPELVAAEVLRIAHP